MFGHLGGVEGEVRGELVVLGVVLGVVEEENGVVASQHQVYLAGSINTRHLWCPFPT